MPRVTFCRPFSLIILSLVCATAAPKVPDWAKTNRHPKYPPAKYFLGVGISKDRTTAIESARADIARQIQVKIDAELQTVESEIQQGQRRQVSSEVLSRTRSSVSETIAGIEIAEVIEAKGQVYALAVLNKSRYLATLESGMEQIIQNTTTLLQSAQNQAAAGQILAAIEHYSQAARTIPEFYSKRSLYTALSGSSFPLAARYSATAILTEMNALLTSLQLQPVSGDNQNATTGQALPQPLIVRVVMRQKDDSWVGVARFPVKARYESGERIGLYESDPDGQVKMNVIAAATGQGGRAGVVIAGLDFGQLADTLTTNLSKSELRFHYTISVSERRFNVHIVDRSGSAVPSVEKLVTALITENGHTVSDTARYQIEGQLAIIKENEVPTPSGKQFFVEASLQLSLIDRHGGAILASLSGRGQGLDVGSRTAAVEKAYRGIAISKKKMATFLQGGNQ